MACSRLSVVLAAVTVLALGLRLAPVASATDAPQFVVTVESAFLREAPSLDAPKVYSVFQGQVFAILGRQAEDAWLLLAVGGPSGAAWAPAHFGHVQGSLALVPVAAAAPAQPTALATSLPLSPVEPLRFVPELAPARFTLQVTSAYGRSAPSPSGLPAASLFKGQTFTVSARLTDHSWVRLAYAGAAEVWVLTAYGRLTGDLASIPVLSPQVTPASTVVPVTMPAANTDPFIRVGGSARELYQRGLQSGNNPRVFARIGDCNSVAPDFLGAFDNPRAYRLSGAYAYLQETVQHFAGSFSRPSLAAAAGLSAAALLDPAWADGRVCRRGENPVACEYRLARPSIALISVGTNSIWQRSEDYEAGLRAIIDQSLAQGIVPILGTKADNLEGDDRLNQIVVRLAGEYDLPLWDFARAARALPDHGLGADRYHLTWGPQVFGDPQPLVSGWQWRNLTALQALDAVWQAVR
jgi:hypothetical protein